MGEGERFLRRRRRAGARSARSLLYRAAPPNTTSTTGAHDPPSVLGFFGMWRGTSIASCRIRRTSTRSRSPS